MIATSICSLLLYWTEDSLIFSSENKWIFVGYISLLILVLPILSFALLKKYLKEIPQRDLGRQKKILMISILTFCLAILSYIFSTEFHDIFLIISLLSLTFHCALLTLILFFFETDLHTAVLSAAIVVLGGTYFVYDLRIAFHFAALFIVLLGICMSARIRLYPDQIGEQVFGMICGFLTTSGFYLFLLGLVL